MLIINFEGREVKGLSKGRYDETFAGEDAKYLGITITDSMDSGQHVSEISSKATKTLGFLRSNLAFAPRSTKEVAKKLWFGLN